MPQFITCLCRQAQLSLRTYIVRMMPRDVSCLGRDIAWLLTKSSSLDRRGNRALIVISCVNLFVLYPGTKAYYIWRNRQRSRIWDAMTPEVCLLSLLTSPSAGFIDVWSSAATLWILVYDKGYWEQTPRLQVCALEIMQFFMILGYLYDKTFAVYLWHHSSTKTRRISSCNLY